MPGNLPEPYKIRVIEPIRLPTSQEREQALRAAHYNVFQIPSRLVYIDLLTDSGTGALSANQVAGLMEGDESYAGARSFDALAASVRDVFGFDRFVPTHQGRAAERILFKATVRSGDTVPNNTHFDTTRANILSQGGNPLDLPKQTAFESEDAFKGDMDTKALETTLSEGKARIPLVMVTVTNNGGGGQPVSLANLRRVSQIAHDHGLPLYLDACRFAENAYFIQQRETGQRRRPIPDIVHEMFALCDGATMSAKKDGLSNIGGFLAVRGQDEVWKKIQAELILTEGFLTYGGLAGRDLDSVARGLREVLDEAYLAHRVGQVARLGHGLHERGLPVLRPFGGHAVYLDAGRTLTHLGPQDFPGQSLAVELYRQGGVRAVELGSLMFGGPANGTPRPEYVRLAIPRRTYTDAHLDYVAEVAGEIRARAASLPGYRVVEGDGPLRHFTAKLEPTPLPKVARLARPAARRVASPG